MYAHSLLAKLPTIWRTARAMPAASANFCVDTQHKEILLADHDETPEIGSNVS